MPRPAIALALLASITLSAIAEDLPPVVRVLPDVGKELPAPDRERLQSSVKELAKLAQAAKSPLSADAQVFIKAADLALRFGEFYDKKDSTKDVAKVDWALQQAKERLDKLDSHPWTSQKGLVIRGFTSAIDGSAQPYGLVIPEGLDLSKPAPLYVWLHGRGSSDTDLHFMYGRTKGQGEVHPECVLDAVVLGHDRQREGQEPEREGERAHERADDSLVQEALGDLGGVADGGRLRSVDHVRMLNGPPR